MRVEGLASTRHKQTGASEMSGDTKSNLMETTELLKRVAEIKRRQVAASEAAQRARKAIEQRGSFVPKQITPAQRVMASF